MIYRYYRYEGKVLLAKRETPFEMKLIAQLILDDLCYSWNKRQLERELNEAIDRGDKEKFNQLSVAYKEYVWE